jgi:prepilin-type N-terminal cleavage/methylation domain-containing protein
MPNKNNYQKMSQLKQKNKAFTLLELLVVISIIGILIALGVVAFSTAQQKSRDARRRGDIKAMQQGFEQYYAENNGSYGTCDEMKADNNIFPGGPPTDPKTNNNYSCGVGGDGYCVCANLETGGGNAGGSSPCPDSGLAPGASANEDWYCLGNLQ